MSALPPAAPPSRAGLNCSESRRPGWPTGAWPGGPAFGSTSARQVLFALALAPAAAAVSARGASAHKEVQAKGSLYAPKKASTTRTPLTIADVRDADVCGSTSAPWSLITRMRRCRGRRHFRAVHGDQIGHRGDRPDQANRNHDGDSHPCAHLHSLCRVEPAKQGSHIFRHPNVMQITVDQKPSPSSRPRPGRIATPGGSFSGLRDVGRPSVGARSHQVRLGCRCSWLRPTLACAIVAGYFGRKSLVKVAGKSTCEGPSGCR